MTLSYDSFRLAVQQEWAEQEELRLGQMYFNWLRVVKPEIANRLRGSLRDPFHKNEIPWETEECVREMWDEGAHETYELGDCPTCGSSGWITNIGTCNNCEEKSQ